MKRTLVFIFFVLISPLIAGLFGIMIDEFAYTVSKDFFTRFRFLEYNYSESAGRYEVAIMGWKNNWMLGFFVGIPLSACGLMMHKDILKMTVYTFKSFLITLTIAAFISILGFLTGKYFLTKEIANWNLPENISDPDAFVAIETMNNFSFMGATIGMLLAILWQMYQHRKDEKIIGYPIQ
jgi:hypothetical protein